MREAPDGTAPFARCLSGCALPPDVEELGTQDETGGEHYEYASRDDADQRPPLRLGRVLDRLGDDPDQKPGGGQGKNADKNCVPGIAEDPAPVINNGGGRGQQVEAG